MHDYIQILSRLATELSLAGESIASEAVMTILNKVAHDVSRDELYSDKEINKEVLEAERREIQDKLDKLNVENLKLQSEISCNNENSQLLQADQAEINRRLRLFEEPLTGKATEPEPEHKEEEEK